MNEDTIIVFAMEGDDPFISRVYGHFTIDRLQGIEDGLRENASDYDLSPFHPTMITYHVEVHDYGTWRSEMFDVPIEVGREVDKEYLVELGGEEGKVQAEGLALQEDR